MKAKLIIGLMLVGMLLLTGCDNKKNEEICYIEVMVEENNATGELDRIMYINCSKGHVGIIGNIDKFSPPKSNSQAGHHLACDGEYCYSWEGFDINLSEAKELGLTTREDKGLPKNRWHELNQDGTK